MKVPKMAAIIVIKIEDTPVPKRINNGPGHAPDSAQPKPNMDPPRIRRINPLSFNGTFIKVPSVFLSFNFLESHNNRIPVITAEPMIPYI